MSKVVWTSKQLEAINHDGENILVSAGAGSGKTAILSERVIRKLKDGVNIDELLILTFTKAASEEMKDRIRKKIIDNNLDEQLNLLDSAYITTFDSFALSIVKKYHYLLNLDKNIGLVDESILKIERSKIIEDVLSKCYRNKDHKFLKFVKDYLKKDDDILKEGIETIIDKAELEIDTKEYFNHLHNVDIEKHFSNVYSLYIDKLMILIGSVEDKLLEMETLIENEKEEKYVCKCNEYYSKLVSSKNYNEIVNFFDSVDKLSLGSANINEDIRNLKKEITLLVNKLKEIVIYPSEEFIKEEYLSTFNKSLVLLDIVEEIYSEYYDYKMNNQLFSFIDIAKLAIKIFKDYPNVAKEISSSLNEIMIDEYQDTSNMQEIFMSYISNDNMYMVGDIKQSIYRFRYANPDLFKYKYKNFKNHNGGYLIDLNTNFRSRREVLENINHLFSNLMSDEFGGANYKRDHLIEYGNKAFLNDNIDSQDNNLEILNYNEEEYEGLTRAEIEAFIVANDIKNKLDNKYLVFDSKLGHRECNYGDFCILVDKRKDFETYKKVFEYFNLPVNLYQNENIVGHDDLFIFNSVLILLKGFYNNDYNKEFIHAYYSLAKSYLFSLTDNDILKDIVVENYKDSPIYTSLENIILNLDILSIKDIFKKIIFSLDWYNKLILKGESLSSEARLAYLLNLSANLDKLGYDLDDVIEYFENIKDKELEIVLPSNNDNNNSIKFMTIHNSKGLEFPLCYFMGYANKFNTQEIKETYIASNDTFILPFVKNNVRYPNIEIFEYKERYLNEEISEKIRLLYVALTRSKEKMIMTLDLNSHDKKNIEDTNSFLDFMININSDLNRYIKNIEKDTLRINSEYKKYTPNKSIKSESINYQYKHIENNKQLVAKTHYSKELKLNQDSDVLDKGNELHNLLFELDFKNPNLDNLSRDNKYLVKRFLNMEFLNLKDAINIYKEYEFIYDNKHGIIDLLIEYNNEYKIIDYKLSNIEDEAYVEQLKGYRDYLSMVVNKPITLYLYSIFKGIYKKID